MTPKTTIKTIKQAIEKNIGKAVCLHIKKGRKTLMINNCIITDAYNSIFVVKIEGESLIHLSQMSVSYADILTGIARISINKNAKPA